MRLLKDGQCVRVCLKGISVEWSASSGTCLNLLRSPNVISSVFDREKKKKLRVPAEKRKKKGRSGNELVSGWTIESRWEDILIFFFSL